MITRNLVLVSLGLIFLLCFVSTFHMLGRTSRVEFYVSGRLVYVGLFKPNADFTMDCRNDYYPKYYPWYEGLKKRPGYIETPANNRLQPRARSESRMLRRYSARTG